MAVDRMMIAGAVALAAVLVAGAAASGSVVASPADDPRGEWDALAVRSISQGSATGSATAPAAAVEPVATVAADGPLRIAGVAGANLNQALAAAGVSNAIAQDYLRAVATRVRLADGISIADRFDLVIDRQPGAERLVYAGLDRVAASDVQLMRWAVDGKVGWIDASGTAAQAEAMRMPVQGRVSSGFGTRYHPILHASRFHRGVDLGAAWGTPIRASADGRVTFAGWSGGYGRQVRIGHGGGLATSYSHMSRIAAASGQVVHRGEVIGFVGSSGLSTGPHLHYEVFRNGRQVDPLAVKSIGGTDPLDRAERHEFNARLRSLLTFRSPQA